MDALPTTGGQAPQTMSSVELADLTGKAHKNVLADIRKMLEELGRTSADFSADLPDAYGRRQPGYALPRRECLILVSGYSVELRARIIDRWEELEHKVATFDPDVFFNDPASLRSVLLTQLDKVIALESAVAEARPKADFYDQFVNADGLYGLQNAGRALGCAPNRFIGWLKQDYLFYQGSALVPRVRFIQMAIFEVKSAIVDDKARPSTFITPKGLTYFAERLPGHLRVNAGQAA